MKKTGIVRRFDFLGRIAIPKEVRMQTFGKTDVEGKPMEIFYNEKNNEIIIRPYSGNDD